MFLKEGLDEALAQEDTTVMHVVHAAIVTCFALQLAGVELPPARQWALNGGCLTLLTWRTAAVVSCIATVVLDSLMLGRQSRGGRRMDIEKRKSMLMGKMAEDHAHQTVSKIVKVLIYAVAGIFVFDNLGMEVKGLVSYMGALGLALSLGAQYMLQDLLGYSAVMLDASIAIGDSVVVGGDPKGSVEAIGYLATKVRTLDGELLIYRNRDFATRCVMNCSRMPHRLVTMHFELAATTPPADLEVARKCAQQAVEELAAKESQVAPSVGGTVQWAEYNMRFYGVWIASLPAGDHRGFQCDLYFYLDGTAGKALECEAKSLTYVRLAELLQAKAIRTQGALLAEALAGQVGALTAAGAG